MFNKYNKVRVNKGFTLIELMITVAIVGILSVIAISSYSSHIAKANRAGARTQLLQVAQFIQRFYVANDNYAASRDGSALLGAIPSSFMKSPSTGTPLYNLSIASITETDFTINMVPIAGSKMANDECGSFSINSLGVQSVLIGSTIGSQDLRDKCWK